MIKSSLKICKGSCKHNCFTIILLLKRTEIKLFRRRKNSRYHREKTGCDCRVACCSPNVNWTGNLTYVLAGTSPPPQRSTGVGRRGDVVDPLPPAQTSSPIRTCRRLPGSCFTGCICGLFDFRWLLLALWTCRRRKMEPHQTSYCHLRSQDRWKEGHSLLVVLF